MIIYLDREEVPNLEDIPSNVLWYLIRKAEGANSRFLKLDRYYRASMTTSAGRRRRTRCLWR